MYAAPMARLNYQHLLYFYTAARLGSVTRASRELHLTQPTISGQIRALERALGVKLFERVGRGLALTLAGRAVYEQAERIFSLGQDLQDALGRGNAGKPARLDVGVADVLPRLAVSRLLAPVLRLPEPVHLVCHDDKTELLLARLALGELDVVLSDVPASPLVKVKAVNHLLGECGVSFLGAARLVRARRRGFPRSLGGAPLWLPMEGTSLRRSLEQWLAKLRLRPQVLGEVGDSDLADSFAQQAIGFCVVPTWVEDEARRQSRLAVLGRVESIRERFYAITSERRRTHPGVAALTQGAA